MSKESESEVKSLFFTDGEVDTQLKMGEHQRFALLVEFYKLPGID